MYSPLSTEKEAAIPLHLLDEIRSETALLFVGSGLSVAQGFPSWKMLVNKVFEKVQSIISEREDADNKWILDNFDIQPDWVAEAIHLVSPDKYNEAIREIFNKKSSNSVSVNHIICALLPFKGFLTTNYDSLIEDYLSVFCCETFPVFDYDESLRNYAEFSNAQRYVLKLHGDAKKDPERIILTSSDYYKLLQDQRYIRLLSSIFSRHTILCIGFSLRDRDFRHFTEERHNLYGGRCPPLYAIVPEDETCPLEISLMRNKYNIHLLKISRNNDFSELTSFLYSLYCLVFGEDSSSFRSSFIDAARNKIIESGIVDYVELTSEDERFLRAKRLLSHLKDPIRPEAFIAFCLESGVEISKAELISFSDRTLSGSVTLKRPISTDEESRRKLAKWISGELESIPVSHSPRHFTSYHKELFRRYSNTLSTLLCHKDCWEEIIGDSATAETKLIRISQFYKQEGRWNEWLQIAEAASKFLSSKDSIFKPLMQTMLAIYFWTRRYNQASKLLRTYPDLDDKKGEHSYLDRIRYMQPKHLKDLIIDIENRGKLDYFTRSLLGRSYAQLSLHEDDHDKFLNVARNHLEIALHEATESGDWIERSVQSWYLALVFADLGRTEEAKHQLSEVRRLDESIMNRVPGLAWLDLAEYRIAINDPKPNPYRIKELREKTIDSFKKLGTIEIEKFIDHEYYY